MEVLWRPIAATSNPVVGKSQLHVATQAFTLFVRFLGTKIPASFLTFRLQGLGEWVRMLGPWGAVLIGEADCKEQFNVIDLATVVRHMHEASQWLASRKCWQPKAIVWSIQRGNWTALVKEKGLFQLYHHGSVDHAG